MTINSQFDCFEAIKSDNKKGSGGSAVAAATSGTGLFKDRTIVKLPGNSRGKKGGNKDSGSGGVAPGQ